MKNLRDVWIQLATPRNQKVLYLLLTLVALAIAAGAPGTGSGTGGAGGLNLVRGGW
jgi:hypothetical protein